MFFGTPPWLILHPQTPDGLCLCKVLSSWGDHCVLIQIVRILSAACTLQISSLSAFHHRILAHQGWMNTDQQLKRFDRLTNEMLFLWLIGSAVKKVIAKISGFLNENSERHGGLEIILNGRKRKSLLSGGDADNPELP